MNRSTSDNPIDKAPSDDGEIEVSDKKDYIVIGVGVLVIILISIGYLLLVKNGADSILPMDCNGAFTKFGTFGDTFGGLNAIFSGLAFLGLIYTILMQRKELSLQRQELRYTRMEMKESVKAQFESAKQQKEQARLIEMQINKDVRPYINAYLDVRDYIVCMVIKNIGKSACHNFQMKSLESLKYDPYDKEVNSIERINNYKLSIVPSGLEYIVPIFTTEYFNEKQNEDNIKSIKVDFSFIYNSKCEEFSIEYNLLHLNTPVVIKEERIKQDLKEICKEISALKRAVEKIKCK